MLRGFTGTGPPGTAAPWSRPPAARESPRDRRDRRETRPAFPVTRSEPIGVAVRFVPAVFINQGIIMKITTTLAVAAGLAALAACNQSPQEQTADNIEANAEMTADNLEEMADETANDATEENLENAADATREAGEENADATREGADADGNSAN